MAKRKTTRGSDGVPVDPATEADVRLAASLIPSSRKARGWQVATMLSETFSNQQMQNKLRSVAQELEMLGLDVSAIIDAANEAAAAIAAMGRLDESAGRVHQRATELNKRILNGQTALLRAKESAAPGTAIAKALIGLASLRQKQVTQTKRAKTTSKKAKKKASQGTSAK